MDKIVIKRPKKERREETLTLRLTIREKESEEQLRKKLKIDHLVDFFFFVNLLSSN